MKLVFAHVCVCACVNLLTEIRMKAVFCVLRYERISPKQDVLSKLFTYLLSQ